MRGEVKLIGLIAAALISSQAQAQSMVATPDEPSRALGQCLVLKTSGADRLLVVRWLAGAMGAGDATSDVLTVNQAGKTATDQDMAALYTRLMTQDCGAEATPLFKARDQRGIEAAGGMLGEIAMRELMNDPKVAAAIGAYTKFLDPASFAALVE